MPPVLKRFDESHATRGVHILLHPHPLLHYLLILRDRECSSTLLSLTSYFKYLQSIRCTVHESLTPFFFLFFSSLFSLLSPCCPLLSILRDGFVLFLHLLLIRSRSSYRYFFSLFHVFAACTNRRIFLFNDLQIDSLLNLSNIVMYYLSRYREVVCAVNQFSFFFWYSKNESSKEFATVTFRLFLDCLILCCIRLSNSRVVDRTIERTTINKIAK